MIAFKGVSHVLKLRTETVAMTVLFVLVVAKRSKTETNENRYHCTFLTMTTNNN